LTVFSQKGGIGKTTTSVNLAVALAAWGLRVCVLDLDSQGNASSSLGQLSPVAPGAYELFSSGCSLAQAARPTAIPGLSLCCSSDALAGVDLELANDPAARLLLRPAMGGADVDLVVIDCPPALGLLPVAALAASHLLVLPVTPAPLARDGLHKAWGHVRRIQGTINPRLTVAGILLTMTSDAAVEREVEQTLRLEFSQHILPMTVPADRAVLTASLAGLPVTLNAPDSAAARAYVDLAQHLLGKIGRPPIDGAAARRQLERWRPHAASPDQPSAFACFYATGG
jgi:chromosome partitioning protein